MLLEDDGARCVLYSLDVNIATLNNGCEQVSEQVSVSARDLAKRFCKKLVTTEETTVEVPTVDIELPDGEEDADTTTAPDAE